MLKVILAYTFITGLILLSPLLAGFAGSLSYFYFIIGCLLNKELLGNGDAVWCAISGFVFTSILAYWLLSAAEKRIAGSFAIPQRVTVSMSAYLVGSLIGALWALIQCLV